MVNGFFGVHKKWKKKDEIEKAIEAEERRAAERGWVDGDEVRVRLERDGGWGIGAWERRRAGRSGW